MKKRIFCALCAMLLPALMLLPCTVLAEEDKKEEKVHEGDRLLLAAGQETVETPINGDLLTIGTELTVNAPVTGSIRSATAKLTMNDTVTRNVTVAAGQVETGKNFKASDVVIAGKEVIFRGECKDLTVYAETVRVLGNVSGKLDVYADTVILQDGITIGKATISAREDVTVKKDGGDISLEQSAYKSSVKFEKRRPAWLDTLLWLPMEMAAAAVLAMVLIFLLRAPIERTSVKLNERPIPFLLRGLLFIVVIPTVAVATALSYATMAIGGALALVYVLLLLLSQALAACVLARFVLVKWSPYLSCALAAAVIALAAKLPYVGSLVTFGCMLVSFGAASCLLSRRKRREEQQQETFDFKV